MEMRTDRKSTRLNSSHLVISYAVFCLKKKKKRTVRWRYCAMDLSPCSSSLAPMRGITRSCWSRHKRFSSSFFFFFNDTATTEIYPLSLPDAFPISGRPVDMTIGMHQCRGNMEGLWMGDGGDRKSTRLNSSHLVISYAVFCLKN